MDEIELRKLALQLSVQCIGITDLTWEETPIELADVFFQFMKSGTVPKRTDTENTEDEK